MKICDAHNDFLTELKTDEMRIKYIKKINHNINIEKICSIIWTTKFKNPIKFIKNIQKHVIKKVDSNKLIVCIEDLGFINKNNMHEVVNFLIELNPFSCGLTWNYDNSLGGGALGKKGLTKLGKIVVNKLEKNGILIDTAHMNKRTFNDFVKVTTKPIYNSHSNIFELHENKRNLNNKQILEICKSSGLFSLSFVRNFISNLEISSVDLAKQVDYFISNFGYKNLAFGTDFFGTKNLPYDVKKYNDFKNIKKELLKMGYHKGIINNIFFKNFYEFYMRNINK